MMPISYEQWKTMRKEAIEETSVECIECDGEGDRECDMGHSHECDNCGGSGLVGELTGKSDSLTAYFSDVVHEIRRACVFSRRDFLGEVGPFVQAFRNDHGSIC